jgi:hypothetical protein
MRGAAAVRGTEAGKGYRGVCRRCQRSGPFVLTPHGVVGYPDFHRPCARQQVIHVPVPSLPGAQMPRYTRPYPTGAEGAAYIEVVAGAEAHGPQPAHTHPPFHAGAEDENVVSGGVQHASNAFWYPSGCYRRADGQPDGYVGDGGLSGLPKRRRGRGNPALFLHLPQRGSRGFPKDLLSPFALDPAQGSQPVDHPRSSLSMTISARANSRRTSSPSIC